MEKMRLDKFLGLMGCCTRTEAKKCVRSGRVTINGVPVTSADTKIDAESDRVVFCGKSITYRKFTYILMNKPEGVVSATEDGRDRTVIDLLPPEVRRTGLFPCGRLDKNTLGLMLITDNGDLAHRFGRHGDEAGRTGRKFPRGVGDALYPDERGVLAGL